MNPSITKVVYNGEPLELPGGSTVSDVLLHQQVRTHLIAVEVNLEVVPKELHDTTILADGDQIEVVTLVGGG